MVISKRKPAGTAAAAESMPTEVTNRPAKTLTKDQNKQAKAGKPPLPPPTATAASGLAALVWRALGLMALLFALASAVSEWPIYLAYEKDWVRPAMLYCRDFSITAAIALLVGYSPPVRALKRRSTPDAAPITKIARNKIVAAVLLVFLSFYYGFGAYGPAGGLTVAALCAFVYLALP